jgi:hypothetical protein
MHELSDDDHMHYLHAIDEFIKSEKILPFGAESFVNLILNEINS